MIKKAIFPAAGLGTRFLPATKAQPKEMLPLVDKPIIQYGIEEVAQSGIKSVLIVTGRGKSAITNHFDSSYELESILKTRNKNLFLSKIKHISDLVNIYYIRQKTPKGVGDAILTGQDFIGDEPFAVIFSDDIIDSHIPASRQLIDAYIKYKSPIIAVTEVPMEETHRYGIIKGHKITESIYMVEDLVEKPEISTAPSNIAIIGRYILEPSIFPILKHTKASVGNEIQLTDALRILLDNGPIYALKFEGKRFDAGDKLGFLDATIHYALKNPEIGESFRELIKRYSEDVK